jgi:signal transduction histidine kinase
LINRTLDLPATLHSSVQLAAELTGAEAAILAMVEPDGQSIAYPYLSNFPPGLHLPASPRGQGVAWQVVASGTALFLPEYSANSNALPQLVQAGVRGCLAVPISVDEDRIGALGLFTLTPGRSFEERDLRLAEAAGRQAGIAIQNSRLFDELRQRTAELEAVASVSSALRSASGRAAMQPIILDRVMAVCGADSALLALEDSQSGDARVELGRGGWQSAAGQRIPRGRGAIGRAMASGKPWAQAGAESQSAAALPAAAASLHAAVCAPLIAHGEILGALCVARHAGPGARAFDSGEVRLLASIGDMAANAIQRATFHEQTRRRLERMAALREIDVAITSSLDLNDTLNLLLERVTQQLGVHAADVLLLNAQAATLDYAAARGFRTEALQHTRLPLGEGNAGRAALEERVVHIPDLRANGGDFSRAPLLAQESFVAYYALPLVAKEHVRGVLEIFHRASLNPDAEWLEFMQSLAGQAAIALDNAVLFQDLQHSLDVQRATQAQLVRAARLTAVGELAAGVAHQINNPLTTVIADAQLLVRSLNPDHPGHASANAIYQAGWRAQRVVQRLLNFARPEEGELIATDLNDTIVAALDLVSAHIQRGGVELHVDLAADLPPIPGSERQLEEVWINLLLNARDALQEDRAGRISIVSRVAEDGNTLEVLVSDNGRGIDEGTRVKIFTPFFTTKAPGRGNGLGLSVCQSIVQNHGGAISYVSTPGEGTTFVVRLRRQTPNP